MSEGTGFCDRHGPLLRQAYTALVVSVNVLSCGLFLGYPAVVLPYLTAPGSPLPATLDQASWIASVAGISQIVGNFLFSSLVEKIGRKKCHILITAPMIVNWSINVLATDVSHLIIARFVGGVGLGLAMPLAPMIIGEMTHPKRRGMFSTAVSLSITLGIVIIQALAFVMTWKQIALGSLILSFTGLFLTLFTKETPAWLLSKGRIEQCTEVFRHMRGEAPKQEQELQEMITKQTKVLRNVAPEDTSFSVSVKNRAKSLRFAIKQKIFYKPLLIMFHINMMMQFSGLPVYVSYTSDVISAVIGPSANLFAWITAMNTERLFFTFVSIFMVRNMNRRTLLFVTGVGSVSTFIGQGACVLAKSRGILTADNQWLPGTLLVLYIMFIGIGMFTLGFTIRGEIFPLQYRSIGSSLSCVSGSLSLFLSTKCFPGLVVSIGLPYTYLLYGGVVIYCLVVAFVTLPETKDRTLQEIEDGFRGKDCDEVSVQLNKITVNDADTLK